MLCSILMRLLPLLLLALPLAGASPARAEILAMMNYESKTPDSLKALKLSGPQERREGIAIIDVDPASPAFGRILVDIPMPADQVVHHIFYDRTMTKAYITSLGQPALQVMDLTRFPYRLRTIETPGCQLGEDVIFDERNERWYLTCMQSGQVFQGDVATDRVLAVVALPGTYPHGLGVSTAANRILVTSTVSADLQNADEIVTVLDATTLAVLGTKRLSLKPPGSGEAPVEVLFVPGATPPVAYVTNLFGGTLWALTWDAATQDFATRQVFDFATLQAGVALEMYLDPALQRLYVTTGSPGQLHVFDLAAGLTQPRLLASYPAGEGAHHVGLTKDGRYAFVQNALLNLPGLSDGSVTVIDLHQGAVVASMDTLKNGGFNPNSLVLLPEWNDFGGH
jgi:DNA-binding beta-propeller fold protein YncE